MRETCSLSYRIFICYNPDMQEWFEKTKSQNPDLNEAEIAGILHILFTEESITNSELVRRTGIPKPILQAFKFSIASLLKVTDKSLIELNDRGRNTFGELGLRPYRWTLLEYGDCEVEQELEVLRKSYALSPQRMYDQFFCTPNSTYSKAKLALTKGVVEKKEIVFLGDDDFVSLALGLMKAPYKKIKVVDIDNHLLEFIKQTADKYGINNLEVIYHDLREDIAPSLLHKADTVFTDPPYTFTGAQLFISRAIDVLKEHKNYQANYILFNYGSGLRNPEKEIKIQSVINRCNLVIEDKLSKFTGYFGAEAVGSRSSIYVLKTTPFTTNKGIIHPNRIYTHERESEERFPYVDHYVFKVNGVPNEIVKSKKRLQKIAGIFCAEHRLTVVDTKLTKFKRQGVSFTFILSSSNLLLHSWPEYRALHLDLLTCSPIYKCDSMARTLSDNLHTNEIEITKVQ